jgi:hypothetical protein
MNQVWWHIPIILGLKKIRKENGEIEAYVRKKI